MPPRKRRARNVIVKATEQLTPGVVRIVFTGELDGFNVGEFTDHYVKIRLPDPADAEVIRTRTYTVRDWDPDSGEMTVDFVVHGDGGIAGPWASAARPGDSVSLFGPGGAYTPNPSAEWHLLAGDVSVIPAIAASLPRIGAGVPVYVVIEVDDDSQRQPLSTPGDLHLTWLTRTAPPGEEPELLVDGVRAAVPELDGRCHAFVHGEASSVRALRRHLVADRGVQREMLSASGYWKLRRDEEGWREDKEEWRRQVEADDASRPTAD